MKQVFWLVIALVLLSGCAAQKHQKDADIVAIVHEVAGALLVKSSSTLIRQSPLLIASFVDINRLDKSSSFGRIISQQIGSAVSSQGYIVKEMLLRNNVYIKEAQGEFLLSRQLRQISSKHNAQAVIVGTYAIGHDNLYVTAKIISVANNTILASHDFTLPLGPDAKALLQK